MFSCRCVIPCFLSESCPLCLFLSHVRVSSPCSLATFPSYFHVASVSLVCPRVFCVQSCHCFRLPFLLLCPHVCFFPGSGVFFRFFCFILTVSRPVCGLSCSCVIMFIAVVFPVCSTSLVSLLCIFDVSFHSFVGRSSFHHVPCFCSVKSQVFMSMLATFRFHVHCV